MNNTKSFLINSFIAIAIAFLILQITGIAFVRGSSMEPTLKENNLIVFDKISYRFSPPKRNDLIAFKPTSNLLTDNKNSIFVKRIIAIPGDHIVIKNNQVFINNSLIHEPYIKSNTIGEIDLTVPHNQLFVMGDNRANSSDSRDSRIGLVSYDSIVGKIAFK